MSPYIKLIRPWQWTKNIFVLPPLLFSGKLFDSKALWISILAFLSFCLISSTVYIINDITDCKKDSYHPRKKNRPIASGIITKPQAIVYAVILLLLSVSSSFMVSSMFLAAVLFYFFMQLSYSLVLKKVVILDVIIIASGFVLRAIGGAVALQVPFTPWLVICIFTLCLFMGFCKRLNELVVLEGQDLTHHRQTLLEYSPQLLTHLIAVCAALTIITFMLYAISDWTVGRFGTSAFIYTVPIVIYCVFRFAALSISGKHDGPSEMLINDMPLLSGVVLWSLLAVLIVSNGKQIHELWQSIYY